MGYWKEDLYSGDDPIDALANIIKFSNVKDKKCEDLSFALVSDLVLTNDCLKNTLKTNLKEIEKYCLEKDDFWDMGGNTHSAVYAELIMRHGLPLSKNLKKLAKCFVKKELSNIEGWGCNIDKRAYFIEDFHNNLENYKQKGGIPLFLSSEFVSDKEKILVELHKESNVQSIKL